MNAIKPLNIVFFGEDAYSNVVLQSLINAGHKVLLVVSPLYDNLIHKRLEFTCSKSDIPFYRARKINSQSTLDAVNQYIEKKGGVDLCVISHFERLIKKPLLDIARLGFINLHPSLLPEYRGMSPQHWPIINREKETGITVHYVDESTDTGDIILQDKISLGPDDYVFDLQKKWMKRYQTIVVEAINYILMGKPTIKQSHLTGSYYGKLKESECKLSLDMDIESAYALVRGVSMPYHGAQYDDVIIWKAHIASQIEYNNKEKSLGIVSLENDILGLLLKNGLLIIEKYTKI